MNKLYFLVVSLLCVSLVQAQCDPLTYDWMGATYGIDPNVDEGETFSDGILGDPYEDFIYLNLPTSASDVDPSLPEIPIDSVKLSTISFVQGGNNYTLAEMGFTLACNNLGTLDNPCDYLGGQLGCAVISGEPLIPGNFDISVEVVIYATVFQSIEYPFPYVGYTMTIEDTDNVGAVEANAVQLFQNSPNPANKKTTVRMNVAQGGKGTLTVMNMLGEEILSQELMLQSGENSTSINTSLLQAGIYFYKLEASGRALTKRLIVSH